MTLRTEASAWTLVRTAIGPLRDPKLASGRWRHLTVGEVRSLYEVSSPLLGEGTTEP